MRARESCINVQSCKESGGVNEWCMSAKREYEKQEKNKLKVQQKNGDCNANDVKNWIILPHNARCIGSKHLSARANSSMKTEGSGTEQAIGVVVWSQRS